MFNLFANELGIIELDLKKYLIATQSPSSAGFW